MADPNYLINGFGRFVESAELLLKQPTSGAPLSEFLEFVQRATAFIARPATADLVSRFQDFAYDALPLVVRETKRALPALVERAKLVSRWLVRDDLLSLAGFSYVEDSYTELIRWALDPSTHKPSALRRQQAWLRVVGLGSDVCAKECNPRTQVWTDDGIPDLVLQYAEVTVVVEAKTSSNEHLTPSGNFQTVAYVNSIREVLKLPETARVEVAYLTPDRRLPQNATAKATTYTDFVFALLSVLDGEELPADTKAAYAMLFTHFLTAIPDTFCSVRELIEEVVGWSGQPDWLNDRAVLDRMKHLVEAIKVLEPEGIHG